MKQNFLFICTLFVLAFTSTQLLAQLPDAPDGKKWVKMDNMSDEFDGTELNTDKWAKNFSGWEGRKPCRFETWAVTVGDGNLRLTGSKKDNPFDGWTHSGGLVRSTSKATYGYYETRMKANKTFLSSTFWLINIKNETSGCDERTTELDVTETIGINTGGENWITDAISKIRSNSHSRNTSCTSTPEGQEGNSAGLGNKSYEGYHTYGVWWKSKTELRFYLDGAHKYTITPPADFDLAMYLRMVVESYDWNPPKDGSDGMNDTWANRTTYYDWTRSWKLEDDDSNAGTEFFIINRETGKKIRMESGSVDGDPLQLVPESWSGNPTKWTMVDTDNGYFYLKNVETGNYFRPTDDSDGSVLIQRPTSYDGSYTQWKQITSSGDYFYLENRANGKYFRPETSADYSTITQRPTTSTGNWTQWKFIDASSGEVLKSAQVVTEGLIEDVVKKAVIYPNPVSSGTVTIETGIYEGNRTISIFNSVGQLVYNYAGGEQTNQVSVDDFDSGLYIVKIQTGNNNSTHKLIID